MAYYFFCWLTAVMLFFIFLSLLPGADSYRPGISYDPAKTLEKKPNFLFGFEARSDPSMPQDYRLWEEKRSKKYLF